MKPLIIILLISAFLYTLRLPLPHTIQLFVEKQDQRLVSSSNERANCINSGACQWSHDGWKQTLTEYVTYQSAGEVLAKDYPNWQEVLKAWDNSPEHKQIIDQKWCLYGAGQSGQVYVIQFACE